MKIKKNIRFKFMASLLGVSVLPILMLFIFTLKSTSEFYQNQVSIASDNDVKMITASINENFKNLNELLNSLMSSQYEDTNLILSISGQEGKDKQPIAMQRLLNNRKFEYVTHNLIRHNSYAEGVYLFTENGYIYSFMKNRELYLETDYQQSAWYNELRENNKYQVIDIYEPMSMPNEKKIVLARHFTDLKGFNKGVLAIVCNDKVFGNISGNNMPWNKGFIIDDKNDVIYGDINSINLSNYELEEIHSNDSGFIHGSNTYIYGKILENNWKVVSEVSFDSLNQLYFKNIKYLVWLIIIIIIIIHILLIVIEKSLIQPLINLENVMKKQSNKSLAFENNFKERDDEIGSLYRSFEKMIQEINQLIQEKYIDEIDFLNLKLTSLMGQINAHFIFNTLENINSLAEIEENKQIVMMSKSLGDMLRYSIEYEKNEVSLIKEIKHIRQYINIQEIRFSNKIFLKTNIENDLKNVKVLKFMLQPIVENAIEHGLINTKSPWIIEIETLRNNEDLIIEVRDSGVGIEKEVLEKIRHRMDLPEYINTNTIALYNIHKRIQLLYSKKYGLKIDSEINHGVTVTIILPLKYIKEEGNE